MAQLLISLFTTGGRPNPVALILFAVTIIGGIFAYQKITHLTAELELARQARVIQDAARDRADTLNEARNDQTDANQAIDDGSFNDWLERVQRED